MGGASEERPPRTEAVSRAGRDLERLSPLHAVRRILREDAKVRAALEGAGPALARLAERFAAVYAAGGRIAFVGAGTSGRLGILEAAECPPTFGTDPDRIFGILAGGRAAMTRAVEGREDSARAGAAAVGRARLGPADLVIGLSASGRTPFVLGAVQAARRRGAATAALTCDPHAPLGAAVDLPVLLDVGPEVVAGSTRMKAGTATKIALGTVTTAAMARLGAVYRGLMVGVRPTSQKLRARARRIVARLGGVPEKEAARLLARTGGEVRPAVLLARGHARTAAEARRLLARTGGHLGPWLDAAP